MIPYPNRDRAARAVHRRREAYQRTTAASYLFALQRQILAPLERELGIDLQNVPTTAEALASYLKREAFIAARTRARMRQLESALRRLYQDAPITSLDT
ncbi:hypothetical protein ACQEV9_18200 [Streptomyces chartreusis]|uniref:hypothetical protein n=1 Tax=Streptomyces chartreusis TaxID=1969 RepID=UPI003D8F1790